MSSSIPDEDFEGGEEITARHQVVLDGNLSKERLLSLIRLGREEEALDYKLSYDLTGSNTKDKVEMARDVVAMANTSGGYLLLGVDENRSGTALSYDPVGIPEGHLSALDIDKLKPQIERYLSAAVPIKLQIHRLDEHEGRCFALIYVEEAPESPIIMEKDGEYQDHQDGRSKKVFREGDIFVRDGGSSRRANQNAVREVVSKVRRRERERWTEEILGVRELIARMDRLIGVLGGVAATQSVGEATGSTGLSLRFEDADYFLGASAFERIVFEALRTDKDVDLMWYLNNASAAFYRSLKEAVGHEDFTQVNRIRDNQLEALLDNLAVLTITCARYRRPKFVPDARDALYAIYDTAHKADFGPSLQQAGIGPSWVWEAVIKRVYLIGSSLLHFGFYKEVPLFIRQQILWESDYWRERFWAKHALTMRARADRLDRRGLCATTEQFIKERKWFYRLYGEQEDDVLAALCQFDFLQCVHAIHQTQDPSAGYPSFGTYYNHRTEPIISKVIKDQQAQEALLPQLSGHELANIIRVLDDNADKASGVLTGWTQGSWQDHEVEAFLTQHSN